MGVWSSKFVVVEGVDTLRSVTVNEQQVPAKGVASNTRQGVVRRPGVRSWNGTANRFGGTPALMPGDLFAFNGYFTPADGVEGSAGALLSGTAAVSQLQVNWSWQNGELLSQAYTFAGHLELDKDDDGAALEDTEPPDVLSVCGTKIQYQESSGGSWVDIPALVTAQLALSVPLHPFVNSDTDCWTGQRVGAPVDWTLTLVQEDERRGVHFDIPDDVGIRAFIDDTNYWELLWGHVRDFTGITGNRETGEILKRTINIDMNAASGAALGHVLLPGAPGTEWWPDDERP
jgi:hypothetical protein